MLVSRLFPNSMYICIQNHTYTNLYRPGIVFKDYNLGVRFQIWIQGSTRFPLNSQPADPKCIDGRLIQWEQSCMVD